MEPTKHQRGGNKNSRRVTPLGRSLALEALQTIIMDGKKLVILENTLLPAPTDAFVFSVRGTALNKIDLNEHRQRQKRNFRLLCFFLVGMFLSVPESALVPLEEPPPQRARRMDEDVITGSRNSGDAISIPLVAIVHGDSPSEYTGDMEATAHDWTEHAAHELKQKRHGTFIRNLRYHVIIMYRRLFTLARRSITPAAFTVDIPSSQSASAFPASLSYGILVLVDAQATFAYPEPYQRQKHHNSFEYTHRYFGVGTPSSFFHQAPCAASINFFRALVSTPAFWFLHHVSHNPTWEYGMPIGTPLLRLESTQTRVPGWGRVRGGYSVVVFKVWYMASSRRAQQVLFRGDDIREEFLYRSFA
ncbi:hypothetical protein FPQ18DRAFT_305643 [Pyronema domesticum]|nr:hypothetical protein FPQ18DRAFT_305643 [Pyronema domesticum]